MSLILNKKLAVVLKADKDIGTGHLMRVKSLLRHIDGVDFYLFTDSLSTELEAFATEYKSIIRGKVCELVSAIKTLSPDLILIDHYFLDYDFDLAILMYQKEFADRMNGEVGSKNYSRLSAMLYFKCNVETLTNVSSESFIPKPKIDSTVVKLTPKENKIEDIDFETYSNFTKALFQHRNKKIRNALIDSRHIISNIDKKVLKQRLNSIEDDELNDYLSKRVIVLKPEEILYISKELNPLFKE